MKSLKEERGRDSGTEKEAACLSYHMFFATQPSSDFKCSAGGHSVPAFLWMQTSARLIYRLFVCSSVCVHGAAMAAPSGTDIGQRPPSNGTHRQSKPKQSERRRQRRHFANESECTRSECAQSTKFRPNAQSWPNCADSAHQSVQRPAYLFLPNDGGDADEP